MIERKPVASTQRSATIARLAQCSRLSDLGPIAGRFVYSLRLIAAYDRAGRDPIPELAVRLASVETAAKAFALGNNIAAVWPENVQVSRFCFERLTHDEATIGALLDAVVARDRRQFEAQIDGLIRPTRKQSLWEAAVEMVGAEMRLS